MVSGITGHAEAVRVVFNSKTIEYAALLRTFWENHDPTQGDRQGNDIGPHYRSGLWATADAQLSTALASRDAYQPVLISHGSARSPLRSRRLAAFTSPTPGTSSSWPNTRAGTARSVRSVTPTR